MGDPGILDLISRNREPELAGIGRSPGFIASQANSIQQHMLSSSPQAGIKSCRPPPMERNVLGREPMKALEAGRITINHDSGATLDTDA